MAEKQEYKEYPRMLYRMGEGNVLEHCVVQDEAAHKEAGKEWKTTPPKKRGRKPASDSADDGS